MSLVFIEGFETFALGSVSSGAAAMRWASYDVLTTDVVSSGRHGGKCITNTSSTVTRNFSVAMPTNTEYAIVGVAVRPASTGGAERVLGFSGNGSADITVYFNSASGVFELRRDTVTLIASVAGVGAVGRWHYVEAKVKIHDTAGYAELRVDGVVIGTFSGDTKYFSSVNYVVTITAYVSEDYCEIDDVYVCDGVGSYNNDFLGDCRVDYLPANADGAVNEFSRSAGSTNYENVDDLPAADNDTTYNQSGLAGDQDLYGCASFSFTPLSILGVQIENVARQTGAGDTRSLKPLARSGGTTYDQAAQPLSESWACKMKALDRDPNGGIAWTESAVNSLEVGLEVA